MKNVLIVLATLLAYAHCIRFYLEPNSMKCLKEESQADVLVNGEYSMTVAAGVKVEFIVRDSKGHILSRKEDIPHGKMVKFSFVTETYDTYEICFISQVVQQSGISDGHGQGNSMRPEIYLISKRGIEAKSYEGIGEASKLKPVEVELKRLEDLSEVIVQDFARMRKNEEELRDTNEAISSRVLYFSMFSMCCMLLLSTWQVIYLKIFFKAKKLID